MDSAKRAAHEQGITLGQWLENAARHMLAEPSHEEPPPVPVLTRDTGPRPGLNWRSNQEIMEFLEWPEETLR